VDEFAVFVLLGAVFAPGILFGLGRRYPRSGAEQRDPRLTRQQTAWRAS
jgi:hypothetical protein